MSTPPLVMNVMDMQWCALHPVEFAKLFFEDDYRPVVRIDREFDISSVIAFTCSQDSPRSACFAGYSVVAGVSAFVASDPAQYFLEGGESAVEVELVHTLYLRNGQPV